MAKHYGDIPCVKLDGIIHITKNGTECLCGTKWRCGYINRDRPQNRANIIWRTSDVVTCERNTDFRKTSSGCRLPLGSLYCIKLFLLFGTPNAILFSWKDCQ